MAGLGGSVYVGQSSKRDYNQVGGVKPPLSRFDLSYPKLLSGDMLEAYPVGLWHCNPGDIWQLDYECIVRFFPMVAPLLHNLKVSTHSFYVPYRLLFDKWSKFITGGKNGDYAINLPDWLATDFPVFSGPITTDAQNTLALGRDLWDYLGYPVNEVGDRIAVDGSRPNRLQALAYYLVWYYYYLDKDLVDTTAISFDIDEPEEFLSFITANVGNIMRVGWHKDRFTTSRPWQQRGTSPAIPLFGQIPVSISAVDDGRFGASMYNSQTGNWVARGDKAGFLGDQIYNGVDYTIGNLRYNDDFSDGIAGGSDGDNVYLGYRPLDFQNVMKDGMNMFVDIGQGVSADMNGLRISMAVQRMLELSARTGSREVEWLRATFGTAPKDERLQMPEFIGGDYFNIQISEIPATTADTDQPLGTLSGKGLGVNKGKLGSYKCVDHGIIITICSVNPDLMYASQGIHPHASMKSALDFYNPHFAHISEQPLYGRELFVSSNPVDNDAVFGYAPYGDVERARTGEVVSSMRYIFDYWQLARYFVTSPKLNFAFRYGVPRKDFLAVQNEDTFIMHFSNLASVLRPLPHTSEPGLIDHTYGG